MKEDLKKQNMDMIVNVTRCVVLNVVTRAAAKRTVALEHTQHLLPVKKNT